MAVTDFMTMVPDQVAKWMPRDFITLGTDGYGRSDSRSALRHFFETDTGHVVTAALTGLDARRPDEGSRGDRCHGRYDIDPEARRPGASSLMTRIATSWRRLGPGSSR